MSEAAVRDRHSVQGHRPPAPSGGAYPFRNAAKVFYVNTTGVCSLACSYCFTNEAKQHSSLDRSDFDFLFSYYGENIYFVFTGVGDFFAGYKKSDELLRHVLSHDVQVYLDFNGVLIHELPDLDATQRDRLGRLDISYHYAAMKKRGTLDRWLENIVRISKRFQPEKYDIKAIVALAEMDLWSEMLLFYKKFAHPFTRAPLRLVLDQYDPLLRDEQVRAEVTRVLAAVPGPFLLPAGMENNFRIQTNDYYRGEEASACLAGQRYFKVDCLGHILPCTEIWSRTHCFLGGLKQRRAGYLEEGPACRQINYAACLKGWDDRTGWTRKAGA